MKKIRMVILATLISQLLYSQEYTISIPENLKETFTGHLNLGGSNPSGTSIGFNSFYMNIDGKPFIPIMGEIHYSRFENKYWEEQILKMKSGGINVIATYVFWNIHETKEGVFDWSGNRDLRRFLTLCRKHDMFALVRIGPFCHGEIRNGGLPDWLYGRPFEVRSNDEGYLYYVKRLYKNIAQQLQGLYYKEGGTIIGIQLENELQHSSAPWAFSYPGQPNESTVASYDAELDHIGVSVQDKKSLYADLGTAHLATLKQIALDEGMVVPLYTVTGWGMAAVLDGEAIPVTAAYPYPFWAKPSLSPFFLFKDIQRNPDYSPVRYDGSKYPSFCAEMGVGIQITYTRRPRVVAEASEALMLRTLGSGANGIGYYMYHGGLTPRRKEGGFFSDEPMGVPKISYDFQAPIGEYGKTRDSYNYLRIIHLFSENFGDKLAPMDVVLPETNAAIKPEDKETLRYSVRSNGTSGFVFLNNFQDHDERIDQSVDKLNIKLKNETINFPAFTLRKGVSAILPFNLLVGNLLLKYATVQPLAITQTNGKTHYFFYAHEGISPEYVFENKKPRKVIPGLKSSFRVKDTNGKEIIITTLTREQALNFNKWGNNICITDATFIQNGRNISLQARSNTFTCVLPATEKADFGRNKPIIQNHGLFTEYIVEVPMVQVKFEIKKISKQRYTFNINKSAYTENLSDIILDIDYVGDNAVAFIDGRMINDHLYYGNSWQIGLKQYIDEIDQKGMYFYFRPMHKGASYLIDFEKDKIPVFEEETICKVNGLSVIPEYQISFILASSSAADSFSNQLEVKIEPGTIRGYTDRGILAFTNIPYCKFERFMPPQKPEPWDGVLDCNTFPPRSMQYMRGGQYDSLTVAENGATRLNVWTKSLNGKKPVMVWLHGGGFSSGAGYANPNDSGTGLARQDVVLVSVNHRLDIMGFLDLSAYGEKYKYSGNVGMMDIVVALEWVRDNIARFGGDPSNITIFGESGGGGKVGTLLCMPSAKGLFHKAIILSGTLLNINTKETTQEYAAATLAELGLKADEVDKLANVPYLELYQAGHNAVNKISGKRSPGGKRSWGFAPTVDGEILVQQPFQPAFADFSDHIPIMIGTTFNELEKTYYGEKPSPEEAKKILTGMYGEKTDAYIKAFTKAYPEYNTPADMLSVDKTFRPYTVVTADAHADKNKAPIYMYMFAWKTPIKGGTIGSCHAYELPFVFHMTDVSAQYVGDNTPEVQALADRMSNAWVKFAYTGRPEIDGYNWKPYTSSKGAIMYFNNECSMRYNYDRELMTIMQNR